MDQGDGGGFGRMAKGSAAIAELVARREVAPEASLAAFEDKMRREMGVYHPDAPWSLEQHARQVNSEIDGHRTLKKFILVMAHLFELQKQYREYPQVSHAFTMTAYKCAVAAAGANGSWELSWDLLGLPDPDASTRPLMSSAEQVAMVALAKERKVLSEALAATRPKKGATAAAKAEP